MKSFAGRARLLGIVVFAALLTCVLALPALAMATPGDIDNPVAFPALPWSAEQTGTLLTTVDGADTFYEYSSLVQLSRGQTVRFTSTMQDSEGCFFLLPKDFAAPMNLGSDPVNATTQNLTVMAPRTATHWLVFEGSHVETFSVSATVVPTVAYKLTAFSAPKTAKRKKKFTVSVRTVSEYDSVFSPIKFVVQRKVGKKWKKYTSAVGGISGGNASYTKFSANLKLPKGTFRVQATFSDVAHPKAIGTVWKTVKVK